MDCVIVVGTLNISAHKSVLSSVSEYFGAMSRYDQQAFFELHHLNPESVQDLINYAYTKVKL